jgi:hypothetical protein
MNDDDIERLAAKFAAGAAPVKPLPSNIVLWAICLTTFVVLSFVIAVAVKLFAIQVLSGARMILYYGLVFLLAALFSRALVEQMIPGSVRLIRSSLLGILGISALILLIIVMFRNLGAAHFVAHGVPCLRLGVISALLSGWVGWKLLARGYLVSPRETITLYGLFAGLVGIAVLALHCPILNSLHILVWHLGAMLIAGLVGFIIARYAN